MGGREGLHQRSLLEKRNENMPAGRVCWMLLRLTPTPGSESQEKEIPCYRALQGFEPCTAGTCSLSTAASLSYNQCAAASGAPLVGGVPDLSRTPLTFTNASCNYASELPS